MTEYYSTGTWVPKEGHEEAFVQAWCQFAGWASKHDGAGTLRLSRDVSEPSRYVSFGVWKSFEDMRTWKSSDEFRPRMAKVQEHVAAFTPAELEVVTAMDGGTTLPVG